MQFFLYFKSIFRSPKPKSPPIAPFIVIYFVFMFVLLLSRDSLCGVLISCVVALAYISGLPLLYGCCSSPNLETAFPINHNKKLVYRFLSSLFMFLVAVAVIIALIAIVLSISSSVQNFLNSFSEMGLYSGLFSFAYIVVMYSSGMIAGFLQRRKHRNIFLILLCVAIFLSSLIMSVYTRDLDEYSGCRLPFSEMYYGQIGLPWLFITFWILIAAGMLGWSIYLGVKHYNPKKF